jgi:hypothetical protein
MQLFDQSFENGSKGRTDATRPALITTHRIVAVS